LPTIALKFRFHKPSAGLIRAEALTPLAIFRLWPEPKSGTGFAADKPGSRKQ